MSDEDEMTDLQRWACRTIQGREALDSYDEGKCSRCEESVDEDELNPVQRKEYHQTGWCALCQDDFFE